MDWVSLNCSKRLGTELGLSAILRSCETTYKFKDNEVAPVILDRLLLHSYPLMIQEKSYYMKEIFSHKKLEKKTRVE